MPVNKSQGLSLPVHGVQLLEHFWQHPICIYGDKGIGKSTLGTISMQALLPEGQLCGNFRFERGRQNLEDIKQFPNKEDFGKEFEGEIVGNRLTWPIFKGYLELFCESDEYYYAVIDSLDVAYTECFTWVCGEYGVDQPDEAKESYHIWEQIKIEFESVFRAIQDCDKSFILLSHQKAKTTKQADGTDFDRMDLSCKPAAAKIAKDLCEFVFHYGYSGTTENGVRSSDRVITVRNKDNSVECSTGRDDVFLQPDGKPLFRFKVPNVASEVAGTIQQAYDNELWDYDRDLEAEEAAARRKARTTKAKKGKLTTSTKKTTTKKKPTVKRRVKK